MVHISERDMGKTKMMDPNTLSKEESMEFAFSFSRYGV